MVRFSVIPETEAPPRPKRNRTPKGFVQKAWLICSECGKGFLRESHIQRQRRKHPMSKGELQFHDKVCQGRWLGKHHGGSNRKSDAA